MGKLTATICMTIAVFVGSSANAEQVLYCQSELAQGFAKQSGRWVGTRFSNERYTIKFNDDFSEVRGVKGRDFTCKTWSFLIMCREAYVTVPSTFIYNPDKGRFILSITSVFGYINDGNDGDALLAGKCEKF